jgi:hypothetical protein
LEDRENTNQIKKQVDVHKRIIEEIEFLLHKSQKRDTVFDDIHTKIETLVCLD